MNTIHNPKNPMSTNNTKFTCQFCGEVSLIQRYNCFDTHESPEYRQILGKEEFYKWVCPNCHEQLDLAYPSRYIDEEEGICAVLVPNIENMDADALLEYINNYRKRMPPSKMAHRIVGNFNSMAEQMHIHQHQLNDKAVHLLKPLIIGCLQSNGVEVWNGFFTGLCHPEENERKENIIYISREADEAALYAQDVFCFDIHLTNRDIIPMGINDDAYRICLQILDQIGLANDDGNYHFYDLSWAIDVQSHLN